MSGSLLDARPQDVLTLLNSCDMLQVDALCKIAGELTLRPQMPASLKVVKPFLVFAWLC